MSDNSYLRNMVYPMFSRLAICMLFLFPLVSTAQYEDGPRTIRIKKESDLAKAKFDNTENRLFVIDRFGNVRDNKIAGYILYVKTKKGQKRFQGTDNTMSPEMLDFLGRQKEAVKIFFTRITAVDGVDHLVQLPDVIEVWFPQCKNTETAKRKKRR